LHHITAFGGKQDPLFRKAVMQSIASEVLVDRRGEIDSFYQEFLNASGCAGQTITCLRAAPFDTLIAANQEVISNVGPSAFKPGPAADGAWIRQMPALELASGNYFAGMTSLILSHVSNEGFGFVDGEIQTESAFANLVNFIIPAYASTIRTDALNFYPPPNTTGSSYATQNGRTIQYLDDTNFLCNLRYLNNAFQGKT
jgi:carboxylesterase type B